MMPRLTFFCELDAAALQALFTTPQIIEDLRALGAGVSLGLRDLGPSRIEIPIVAGRRWRVDRTD